MDCVCMYVWIDGWMDGWKEGLCMYGWLNRWMDEMNINYTWMQACLYRSMSVCRDR